ncbi:MAG: DNA polymerase III subunit beta [Bacilli bacterium]|nr:DNA polymerase III subunit beta [Bacilli bacterium]
MKFVIKQDVLLESLNHTARAISPRNLIPILTGIKFELKEEGLYLSASDTDISIRCLIPNDKIVDIKELGSIVIGGKYIVEIIKKLPNTDITIEVMDGHKMIVSTANTEFNLNGINPQEFPNLDLEESNDPIILETKVFKKIINQTFFATSQNESRPLLTGINFRIDKNNMEVIATDSYRLAKKAIVLDREVSNTVNIVIPGKNLLELSKVLDDDKESLELHIFENKVLFKYKNILFLSRLLSGTYPATSSIIPTDFSVSVECSCSGLFEMIDRASLLTSDRDKNTIKLILANNEMIILSNSPEIGKVEEKMSVESSDEISISFSSKYMLDSIKSFETSNITLYMNNDNSPIIIKSDEDDSLIQLVLPIKTY